MVMEVSRGKRRIQKQNHTQKFSVQKVMKFLAGLGLILYGVANQSSAFAFTARPAFGAKQFRHHLASGLQAVGVETLGIVGGGTGKHYQ